MIRPKIIPENNLVFYEYIEPVRVRLLSIIVRIRNVHCPRDHLFLQKLKFSNIPDEPRDYDELAEDDDAHAGGSGSQDVNMEDADAILNEDDTDPAPTSPGSALQSSQGCSSELPSNRRASFLGTRATPSGETPSLQQHARCYSTSSSTTARLASSSMPALYFSTQMARASAFPARILGGGLDPLPYGRFGDLSGDPRHHLATHRHIFENSQNISTSFDPKTMHCNACASPHPVLWPGGGTDSDGHQPKCFVLSDQCFPPALPVGGGGEAVETAWRSSLLRMLSLLSLPGPSWT
jgi:hypothetical protein